MTQEKTTPLRFRRIIVHCGLPKTGSSFIQSQLAGNRKLLADHSICYPALRNGEHLHNGNHSIVPRSYHRGANVRRHFDLRVNLHSDCDTLLLSAEGFPKAANQDQFLQGFRAMFPRAEFQFVFYVRRFDHWAESVYSQAIKQFPASRLKPGRPIPDYLRRISPFMSLFGKEAIAVRPYNRKLWTEGSLLLDFLDTIGLAGLLPTPSQDIRTNTSLPRPAVHVLTLLDSKAEKRRFMKLFCADPRLLPEDRARFFRSPNERREFNQGYLGFGQQLADVFGLGDISRFLDLDDYNDDPYWTPFYPDVRLRDIADKCRQGSAGE